MADWKFTKGLHDIGNGSYAYLQPDGGWGWSNAGLITDGDEALLVDTLFDLKLTREMLDAMRDATPQANDIGTLINTHSNGDHTFGNQLVEGAEIIASAACAAEMKERGPEELAQIMREAPSLGEGGKFLLEAMGPTKFDFNDIVYTMPTRTFDKSLTLTLGDKTIEVLNVGPAHTGGDTLVYIPEDRTVFTGDILFNEGHPILWAGPIANWVSACDLMLGWDLETVVPGHGAITDKSSIRNLKEHLIYIDVEARKRYDAGMGVEEAALDIVMDAYDQWSDPERIVINVMSLFREYGAPPSTSPRIELHAMMSRYRAHRRDVAGHDGHAGHKH
ncbi:MAG: MBL fold metallo-hydrolase [Alphaproteobacteria bacterium]|jgi:cyclase